MSRSSWSRRRGRIHFARPTRRASCLGGQARPGLRRQARVPAADGCGRGRGLIRVKRLALRLEDRVRPTGAERPAFRPGSKRGIQTIRPPGADVGAGIHRFLLQVNGEPVAATGAPCRATEGIALRLRPCPLRARTTFKAATTSSPFRQGPNPVADLHGRLRPDTRRTGPARAPRAGRQPLPDLKRRPRTRARGSSPAPAPAVGAERQRFAAGSARRRQAGARGAGLCGHAGPIAGAGEHIAATPVTGPDGRFRPTSIRSEQAGPRRLLVERYRGRGAPPRPPRPCPPATKLRPRHAVHNGRRVRFRVRLQGPGAAPVGSDPGAIGQALDRGEQRPHETAGAYRAHYRFHSTSGQHRYAFRAVVPKPARYPYRGGHSKTRRIAVIG